VLAAIGVLRPGAGRLRTTPDAVLGDKAYSSQSAPSCVAAAS